MRVEATLFTHPGLTVEPDSLRQLKDACRVPSVRRVLATPDIHVGFGVPIGCVLATEEVVIPAAVGYDINCGMRLMTMGLDAAEADVRVLALAIRRDIPLGEGKRNISMERAEFLQVLEHGVPALAGVKHRGHPAWDYLEEGGLAAECARIEEGGAMQGRPEALSERAIERGQSQLGTLGGGNHFIELQEVVEVRDPAACEAWGLTERQLVVMIHSGSRGFGHQVGEEYMALARSKRYSEPHPTREICYMPAYSKEGRAYLGAMHAGANLAFANRHLMAALVRKNVRELYPRAEVRLLYDVPHNMAKLERHGGRDLWVHRKGATRAFGPLRMTGSPFEETGQPVLIPGSMGTSSYLLAGVPGGERALCSTNHGAGRCMSRTAAAGRSKHHGNRTTPGLISDEAFARAMEGITLICEDRRTIKEEAPQAYKDIDLVIEAVVGAGLARVVAKMRPLAVLKG
jgi:tRNA-splicing ligase RtcB (3'-phosphate/5'-hydroxy nucleic acid ligase)